MIRLLFRLVLVVSLGLVVWPFSTLIAQTSTFHETFPGNPGAPLPAKQQEWAKNWDISDHGRDNLELLRETPFAEHGENCAGPPATHNTHRLFENATFQCKDHVMTSIHPDGYGVTYLTPNQVVDFSSGEAIIRWRMSTHRTSERDWVDVWITPYNDNLQLPLNPGFPDLQGPPRRAVQVLLKTGNSFCPNIFRDGNSIEDNQAPYKCKEALGYQQWLTPDAARRDLFEIRLSRTHLKIGMPEYNQWWYDNDLDSILDWSSGIVQFGHHSYSPEKGTSLCDSGGCRENTWHWDDVELQPSTSFHINHTDSRKADNVKPTLLFTDGLTRPQSYLRFSAWGSNVQYSTNAGVTWTNAQKAVQDNDCCHIFNYWTPIVAGVDHVVFRADPGPGGYWQVKDVTVWSKADDIPTATSTSMSTSSPTSTPMVLSTPTATQTPQPTTTLTLTPTPSETPLPTVTASPTVTPQPTMFRPCRLMIRYEDDGTVEWSSLIGTEQHPLASLCRRE